MSRVEVGNRLRRQGKGESARKSAPGGVLRISVGKEKKATENRAGFNFEMGVKSNSSQQEKKRKASVRRSGEDPTRERVKENLAGSFVGRKKQPSQ